MHGGGVFVGRQPDGNLVDLEFPASP